MVNISMIKNLFSEEARYTSKLRSMGQRNYENHPDFYRAGTDFPTNEPIYRRHKGCPTDKAYSLLMDDFCDKVYVRTKQAGIPFPSASWICMPIDISGYIRREQRKMQVYLERSQGIVDQLITENPEFRFPAEDMGYKV